MNLAILLKVTLLSCFPVLFLSAEATAVPEKKTVYSEEALMDKVSFRVDMSGQSVSPSGMYLAGSFFSTIGLPDWTPMPMCDIGNGLWEISFCGVPPGNYQYKFLNGPGGWEFDGFGAPCTNAADNNNRFPHRQWRAPIGRALCLE